MLLSDDYCVDFWNVFEFNVAVMEGLIYLKTSNHSCNQETIPLVKMKRVLSFNQ